MEPKLWISCLLGILGLLWVPHPRINIRKMFLCHVGWTRRGCAWGSRAAGPCFVSSFRKLSANACSFFSHKAMADCHEIAQGKLASHWRVYLNLYNTLLKVSNCQESLCKLLVKGYIKKVKCKRKIKPILLSSRWYKDPGLDFSWKMSQENSTVCHNNFFL